MCSWCVDAVSCLNDPLVWASAGYKMNPFMDCNDCYTRDSVVAAGTCTSVHVGRPRPGSMMHLMGWGLLGSGVNGWLAMMALLKKYMWINKNKLAMIAFDIWIQTKTSWPGLLFNIWITKKNKLAMMAFDENPSHPSNWC